ncbi:putative transcriptional regulatory [Hyphodiscus hymeniophilus]|uniref:Transcriptional regulatory n=1 Tax=Hyphodiscus hymeniophilus TaxID=353542 RepID=A0A9P6VSI7_9HELO|nr:putative transcriptional regulatory [Hyphodiscus hymeniophilus]
MTQTANIRSPHSLAAILSPSALSEDSAGPSRSTTPKRTHTEAFAGGEQPYLHPASPTQQRASISFTAPRPNIRGADDGANRAMKGGQEEKKPQKMVRSSIACARCRRSKVKCVNEGTNSTCKACAASGRDCQYPPSGSTATPKRSDAAGNSKQEEGESKKRARKIEDTGRRNSARAEDPLECPILTKKVWDEVYEIFKLHFSTEMPFLHPPTFRHRMRQASYPRDSSVAPTGLQDGRVLLLGVLTLTARFHPDLVAYHSQTAKPNNPQNASEYYANALKTAFGPTGAYLTGPSIDGIQALLMLGLYEWGQSRGLSAWVYVGIAMRLAQSMGLAYDDGDDHRAFKRSTLRGNGHNVRENAIEKEVRRRTLWSCFIMDRMLSAGKYRPTMISTNQLEVQLPCSDDQFLFVRDVFTGFLDQPARSDPSSNDDGVLSWYIRLVEIFGRFSEWSYAGGRRTETLPPWDERTQFYKLRQELEKFQRELPANMTFTEANLSAHIEKRNATTYASMHTLYSLCLIMLHREYIPFIPLRCRKPQGPLDEPLFPEKDYPIPEGFWEVSAETLFKSARDVVDIVRTCQDNNALPESPQIGFAVWQAAFVCVSAVHFPHMDLGQHLVTMVSGQDRVDYQSKGYDSLAVKILGELVPRLRMAAGYVKLIGKMHTYFSDAKAEYHRRFQEPSWSGGGLEQYKTLEKELKEFGSLQDSDKTAASEGSDTVNEARSRASTNDIGQGSVNGEAMQGIEAAATPRPWAAINSTSPATEMEERKYNPNQGFPYNPNYQQSPAQNSNPPSLVSPGESTPGINSPYTSTQSYAGTGHQQHVPAYAPIGQQVLPMAPPGAHAEMRHWSQEDNATWITRQEGINASALCDNMAQQDFPGGQFDGFPADLQNYNNQNYTHILNMWPTPTMAGVEPRAYY